jgi:hypothetical protein
MTGTVLVGRKFETVEDLFTNPFCSSNVKIFKVSYLNENYEVFDLNTVKAKAMKVELDENKNSYCHSFSAP